MNKKILPCLCLAAIFMLLFSSGANAQIVKNRTKKENEELRAQVDSLKKVIEALRHDNLLKDSLANEMLEIYEENEDKGGAGLNPEDYSPEITDSLLNIWYLHRKVNDDTGDEQYDMDSLHLPSRLSDEVLRSRLEDMNSFITLPYNETVRNYMVLYTEKMPTKMSNILGLCQYYMPIFEETFNRYNLPDELKYVAIIESALNPTAVSRAGAKGMWQFMTQTAKSYGLEINSFVDERLDPFKSSDAAARYLDDSYRLFGDWNLAISSYNCGPGNVNKAIRRNGGSRDFWAVYDYLPKETRGYVPAFVGAMYAIKYSKDYGLTPTAVPLPVQVDTFEIRRNLHLQQVSDLVGIPLEELKSLNPQYIKDVIPGNSKPYILRIPFNYSSAFIANEDSLYTHRAAELLSPQTLVSTKPSGSSQPSGGGSRISYKVRSGDSLGKIASKHRVTVDQLKRWNNLKSNTIRVGQRLYIYKGGSPSVSSSSGTSKPKSAPDGSASGQSTYQVRKGDTVYSISRKFGLSPDELMKHNGIKENIQVGQILKIPQKS